jgi:hypothetical protein
MMQKKHKTTLGIAAAGGLTALFSLSQPALAHHSFAMFDQTTVVEKVDATVREFHWKNPHTFVIVSVEEEDGVTDYVLECSSINMLTRGGWKFNILKPGDPVDVEFYPLRNGKPGGMLKTIKLDDGDTLKGW